MNRLVKKRRRDQAWYNCHCQLWIRLNFAEQEHANILFLHRMKTWYPTQKHYHGTLCNIPYYMQKERGKKGKKKKKNSWLSAIECEINEVAYKKMKEKKEKGKEGKNQVPYLSWGIIVKSSFRNLGLWYCYNGSCIISIKAERKHIYFSFSHGNLVRIINMEMAAVSFQSKLVHVRTSKLIRSEQNFKKNGLHN